VYDQRIPAMDAVLRGTLARWWATHKGALPTWETIQPALIHQFVSLTKFEVQDISATKGEKVKAVELYEGKIYHSVTY